MVFIFHKSQKKTTETKTVHGKQLIWGN